MCRNKLKNEPRVLPILDWLGNDRLALHEQRGGDAPRLRKRLGLGRVRLHQLRAARRVGLEGLHRGGRNIDHLLVRCGVLGCCRLLRVQKSLLGSALLGHNLFILGDGEQFARVDDLVSLGRLEALWHERSRIRQSRNGVLIQRLEATH